MINKKQKNGLYIAISDRNLSVVVFSLFFSWQLSFPFEGQVLYSIFATYGMSPDVIILSAIFTTLAGLFFCSFFIKSIKSAKNLMLGAIIYCFVVTCVFFSPPSDLWIVAITSSAFLAGGCVAAWGFFLKRDTPKSERIKTVADALIGSNLLMIFLNISAIYLSPYIGLGLSLLMLTLAFIFALRLSTEGEKPLSPQPVPLNSSISIVKPLAFLCLFIIVITINSGLMYRVVNPAYGHLEWLTSWYWAVPYIVALYVMKTLPRSTNRNYFLYVAIAMIGFSFILFMILDRSAFSYLVVNSLMLGACGVYDLFWWSILGEMLEYDKNPAKILGIGLSANVLGVLVGGQIGSTMASADINGIHPTIMALGVVCVTLIMLPVLHKHLSILLSDHAYLTVLTSMVKEDQNQKVEQFVSDGRLTEREKEIAALLLKGKTYRMIAGDLCLSENTIKTHVKNIYGKYKIQSRTELVNLMMERHLPEETEIRRK